MLLRTLAAGLALGLALLAAFPAAAQRSEIYTAGRQQHGTDLAIGGFDPVAYHTQQQAVPGTGQFRVAWKGVEWRFASEQNRDAFVQDPERYAPQYGGWCAFAVANNAKAPSDPRIFDLHEGRLYLNQSPGTQASWRRSIPTMIQRGDQNWPRIANQ